MVADIASGVGYLADLYRTPPRESDPALINSTAASDAAAVRPVERADSAQDRQDRGAAQNRSPEEETPTRSAAAEGFAQASQDRLNASTNAALLEVQEQRLATRSQEPPQPTREPAETPEPPEARAETEPAAAQPVDAEEPSIAARLSEAQQAETLQRQARSDELETREQRADQTRTVIEEDRQQTEAIRADQREDAGVRQDQRLDSRIEDNLNRAEPAGSPRDAELNTRPEAPAQQSGDPSDDGLNAAARAAQEVNPTTAALEQSQEPEETATLRTETAPRPDELGETDETGPAAVTRPETGASIGDVDAEVTTPNTRFETRFDRADSGLSTRDNGLSQTDPTPSLVDRLSETAQEPQRVRQVSQPLDNNLDSAVTPQEIAQSGVNLRV